MNRSEIINDLTEGNVTRKMILFAIPFCLATILQTCYSMVDMIIVGKYIGTAGVSAISNGGDILNMFTHLGVGLSNAGQTAISQLIGKGDRSKTSRMIGTMCTVILGLAIVLSVVCCICTGLFIQWLNVPEESVAMAHGYLLTCFVGLLFIFGYNMVSAILRGMGDSRHPLIFVAIAAAVNLFLDVVFIGFFQMGTVGAALATVIGQGVSFLVSVVFLYRKRSALGLQFSVRDLIPEGSCLRTICKLGIPMALQSTAVSLSVLFVASFINSYGVVASAVTGIGNKLLQIPFIVTSGLSVAGTTMIGQNFGAGKHDRVKECFRISMVIGLLFCSVCSLIIFIFPEQVFSIFDSDPKVLAMSHQYVPIAILNFMGAGLRAPYIAFINGIGFPSMNFLMGILDGIVMRIGIAILLGITCGLGIMGFWLGNTLAGYAYFVLITPYYLSGRWKKRSLIVQ